MRILRAIWGVDGEHYIIIDLVASRPFVADCLLGIGKPRNDKEIQTYFDRIGDEDEFEFVSYGTMPPDYREMLV
jgi:hypothetical protein